MSLLADRIRSSIDPTTHALRLSGELIPALHAVTEALLTTEISLQDATLTEDQNGTRVSGHVSILGLDSRTATLTILNPDSEDSHVQLVVEPAAGYQFKNSFPSLPPSNLPHVAGSATLSRQPSVLTQLTFDNTRWTLESELLGETPGKIAFAGMLRDAAPLRAFFGFLATAHSTNIEGWVRVSHTENHDLSVREFSLGLPQIEHELAIGPIAVNNVAIAIEALAESDAAATASLVARGHVVVAGETLSIRAERWPNSDLWSFRWQSGEATVPLANGLSTLMEWVGGPGTDFEWPTPLATFLDVDLRSVRVSLDEDQRRIEQLGVDFGWDASWTVVPNLLVVSNLHVTADVVLPFESEYRYLTGSIGGTLAFGSDEPVHFDVTARKDNGYSISGSLANGERIHLARLVEKVLGEDFELPEIDVTALDIEAEDNGHYSVSGTIESEWRLSVGATTIAIEGLQFAVDHQPREGEGAATTGVSILGRMRIGEVQFLVSATRGAGDGSWSFSGSTDGSSIHLTKLVSGILDLLGVSLPSAVPEITLKGVNVTFDTGTKEFSFRAETDTEIEVPFVTGDGAKIHAQVALDSTVDSETGKRSLAGFMEGDLTIGSSLFKLQYSLGQDSHVFQGSWESTDENDLLGIETLLGAMGVSHDVAIPPEIDLNLQKVYLEYQAERTTLKLVADSKSYGEVFLIVSKLPLGQPDPGAPPPEEPEWEFVLGWSYQGVTDLSQVPVLGNGFEAFDFLHLENIGVLVSTAPIRHFDVPEMSGLHTLIAGQNGSETINRPEAPAARRPIGAGTTLALGKGLTFVATIDLANSEQTGAMPALRQLVSATQLTATAGIDLSSGTLTLAAMLAGGVTIPTGGKSDLRLANAGLEFVFVDGMSFQVFGELDMHFGDQVVDVSPRLTISLTEIEFSVDVEFPNGWHKPMGIPGLTLDEVGFEMGINLEPAPGVNLGLEGKSHIGAQQPGADSFAFVLEIIEELPNPLLLSFSAPEISIPTAFDVFLPEDEQPTLPNFVNQFRITDLSFSWAESVVTLPDGTIVQPGLSFSGALKILGFEAYVALAIDQASGIAGTFESSPIPVGGVLSIHGHGKGVYRTGENGVAQPVGTAPTSTSHDRIEVVAPGGPELQFRTTQSPYLFATFIVDFLDFAHAEVEALVTDQGMAFKLEYGVGILHAELDFTVNKDRFHCHSQYGIHLKADIGPIEILGVDFGTIHLDTGFDLEMEIEANADDFMLRVWGEFDFEGARLKLPELKLEFAPKSLADLPEMILKHIDDLAEEIFKDLFDAAVKFFEDAGKEIAKLAEEGAEEVGRLAVAAEQEVVKIAEEAEQAVEHTVEEVAHAVADIEKEAEEIATKAADEVKKVAKAAEHAVEEVGKEIAHVAEEAEHEIEAIGSEIAHEAEVVAHQVARLAQEAWDEVKAIGAAVEKEVQQVLAEAKRIADAVINAARKVVDAIEKEAQALWDEAKRLADAIANAAKKVGHAISHAAKSVWHAISKY